MFESPRTNGRQQYGHRWASVKNQHPTFLHGVLDFVFELGYNLIS